MAKKFVSFENFSADRKPVDAVDESAEIARAKLDITNKMSEIKNKMLVIE
jgi:hypothetical protein